jgi:hypothetical protein
MNSLELVFCMSIPIISVNSLLISRSWIRFTDENLPREVWITEQAESPIQGKPGMETGRK